MGKISWPTVVVMCVAIAAVVVTVLGALALKASPETMAALLGGEGVLAAVILAAMRQVFAPGGES